MADTLRPQYRVTGPLVYLKTSTPFGTRLIGFKQNALVPADVPQDQIDHHLSVGLIEEVDAPDAPPKAGARKGG